MCLRKLADIQILLLREAECIADEPAKEHLKFGAARRIGVMRRSIENIFSLFPVDAKKPIGLDAVADTQINLHAFVINLYGIFDNLAWALVHLHGLLPKIQDPRRVGIFVKHMKDFLPARILNFIQEETMQKWRNDYLVNYRDALAHRIPLYIPPATFTDEEALQYQSLESQKSKAWKSMNAHEATLIHNQQLEMGGPSFVFLHRFSGEAKDRPVYIHAQVLCDAKTVISFVEEYLQCWKEPAQFTKV